MLSRRFHLPGLFAVLMALMALLGAGASVPQIDPITGTVILCHDDGGSGGTPSKAPDRPFDCPVCPLCIAMHVPAAPLVSTAAPPGSFSPPSTAVEVPAKGRKVAAGSPDGEVAAKVYW